jgi:hypothetical protein
MDTLARLERLESELLTIMKAIDQRLRINTVITLAATSLTLPEMVGGFEREVLLRETLASMERKGQKGGA